MKRVFVLFITIALLAALTVPEALAKRSRGGRGSSRSHAARGRSGRHEARSRSSRGRAERRGHSVRAERRGRGERAGRRGKLSRRERRELARSERGGRVRERIVVRGRHGRRVVRYRYVRRRSEPEVAPVAATPHTSGSGIPTERVLEIQNALIKAGYLAGPASGQYDDATVQAMKGFQAANGFSMTGAPSAPALKKLGVSKRSNDGFAMPVNSVSESERKARPPQTPE
jgi:hypothetical protein